MQPLHVAVLGGGSVGLGMAASMAVAGARVTLAVRSHSVARLQGLPLKIGGLFGEHTIPAGTVTIDDASAPSEATRSADVLIVTTKAQDVEAALQPFAARTGSSTPLIVLMQNGVGSAEHAREVMGKDVPVYSTAMMIGMERIGDADMQVKAHSGPVNIGSLLGDDDTLLTPLLALAENGFVPMRHDPDIRHTVNRKLLFNCCMNPTGALTDRSYGELLQNLHSRDLIVTLAEEALAVFAATSDFAPAASGGQYVDNVLDKIVFPNAEHHRSSMLQDLEAGRVTEIDFLNGAIVRMGDEAGLATPTHQAIVSLIHASEH